MPGSQGQSDMSGVGAVLLLRREEYIAGYIDLPPGRRGLPDSQILDDGVNGALGGMPGSRKVSEVPFEVNEFPGREVVIDVPGKGTAVLRSVVAGGRVYCLIVAGPSVGAEAERARRFLDSFAITDPQRLAIPGQRREAARQLAERQAAERARTAQLVAEAEARREAAAARERAERAAAEAFRNATRPVRPAAAPGDIDGLFVHLPFDTTDPGGWAQAQGPPGAGVRLRVGWVGGPGVRGQAVYLPAQPPERDRGPALPPEWLPARLASGSPVTVAGWVRVRSVAVELFRAERDPPGAPALALGLADGRVWARVEAVPQSVVPGESQAGRVSAPWAADDDWHHLAATVEAWGDRRRVKPYLDGRRVAVGDFTPPPSPTPLAWAALGRAGTFTGASPPVVGLDDLCVFGRALVPDEVRRLAGVGKAPTDRDTDPEVRLVAGKKLPPVRDVVFDPAANRLYFAVDRGRKANSELLWQQPTPAAGDPWLLNVDELPVVEPDEPPRPIGAHKKLAAGDAAGYAVASPFVSADGKWLYFFDRHHGAALCRVAPDLSGPPERLRLPSRSGRLFPTPEGEQVKLVLSVKGDGLRLAEVDLGSWAVKGEVRLPPGAGLLTCHPDGRVFGINTDAKGTAVEIDPKANTTRVRSHGLNHSAAFLDLSPDGRVLLVADVAKSGTRVIALDATAGAGSDPNVPAELGRLADATGALQVGGPFRVTPDGKHLVFRSGQVVRVDTRLAP